jgi:hypothetical protein
MVARHGRRGTFKRVAERWQFQSIECGAWSQRVRRVAWRILTYTKPELRTLDSCKGRFPCGYTGMTVRYMAHWTDMTQDRSQLPDFRDARHPSRMYTGSRTDSGVQVVVSDSALPVCDTNPQVIDPRVSRGVVDCGEFFQWGDDSAGSRQLAVALLLDVTGDAATALRWHEHFALTYVNKLGATWSVPEIDVALWLYCFENARPGS